MRRIIAMRRERTRRSGRAMRRGMNDEERASDKGRDVQ